MANFVYEPLDTCTFRLLRLFKGRKHYDDRVCCELYEAPHPSGIDDDEDVYEALSYTWGNPDDTEHSPNETRDILMNDHQVSVTKNLYNALYHLRYPGEDRIIWVDALCINQRDASERSLQVRQMCVFYSKAKSVIIWLGESSEGIKLLMEGVRELDRRILRLPKPRGKDRLEIWYDEGRSFVRSMAPSNYRVRREALEKLMKRSWFRRIWVVQEAAVASRATIQCSWESAPTRTFALMPDLMDIKLRDRVRTLLEVMPGPRREQSWWREDRKLGTLLLKFGKSEATDERDKIFALLGISVDAAVADCPLKVDYDADMAEVRRRTISFLVCGDVLDVSIYTLPVWPLEKLRLMLPSLRRNIFKWALRTDGSHAPLLRRLIHGLPRIDINVPLSDDGLYPIEVLVDKDNSAEDVGALLECEHFNTNKPMKYFTPLSFASRRGRADIVRLLLGRQDIKPWYLDPCRMSPLDRAMEDDHLEIMDILLDHGCTETTVSARSWHRQQLESTMIFAARQGKVPAISRLLSRGVSPDIQSFGEFGRNLAKSPLAEATKNNHPEAVALLLGAEAEPGWSREKDALLGTAVSSSSLEVARILLDAGANPNAVYGENIILRIAVQNSDTQIAGLLIDKGARLNSRRLGGATHLIIAAWRDDIAMVRLLVARGANIEAKEDGCNTFWHAVVAGSCAVAEFLADQGADVTVPARSLYLDAWTREESWSLLTPNVLEKKHETVRVLLDIGVFPCKDGPPSWRDMCRQHLSCVKRVEAVSPL